LVVLRYICAASHSAQGTTPPGRGLSAGDALIFLTAFNSFNYSLIQKSGTTKAKKVVAKAGRVRETKRSTHETREDVPGTAAHHTSIVVSSRTDRIDN
jgi:hypothetical protein